jgi:AraC-like DNA-binding protein
MTARLYTLLAHLMENAALTDTLPPVRSGVIHVQRACEYIADNYTRRITIDEIAEYVYLSRSQLYRVFMQHLSLSPHHYLTEFRMREACTLMEKKPSSIKEIAYTVGIDNPLYFSACFKHFIGQTPTEYIKANSEIFRSTRAPLS